MAVMISQVSEVLLKIPLSYLAQDTAVADIGTSQSYHHKKLTVTGIRALKL